MSFSKVPVLVLVLVAAATASVQSVAKTPEELATYVLLGVEEGANMKIDGLSATWRRIASSPASFLAEGVERDQTVRVTIVTTRVDGCTFETNGVATQSDGMRYDAFKIVADFGRIYEMKLVDAEVFTSGDGLCVTDRLDSECHVDMGGLVTEIDPARHTDAYQRLRHAVCIPAVR